MHRVCGVLWLQETVQAVQGSEAGKICKSGRELYTATPGGRMAFPEAGGTGVKVANGYSADLVVKAQHPDGTPCQPVVIDVGAFS